MVRPWVFLGCGLAGALLGALVAGLSALDPGMTTLLTSVFIALGLYTGTLIGEGAALSRSSDTDARGRTSPGGARIAGWVATVFCGLLALSNAATIASSDAMRIFLTVGGIVLIGIAVVSVVSWSVRRRREPRGADRRA